MLLEGKYTRIALPTEFKKRCVWIYFGNHNNQNTNQFINGSPPWFPTAASAVPVFNCFRTGHFLNDFVELEYRKKTAMYFRTGQDARAIFLMLISLISMYMFSSMKKSKRPWGYQKIFYYFKLKYLSLIFSNQRLSWLWVGHCKPVHLDFKIYLY